MIGLCIESWRYGPIIGFTIGLEQGWQFFWRWSGCYIQEFDDTVGLWKRCGTYCFHEYDPTIGLEWHW
jgi:hypothetical protein